MATSKKLKWKRSINELKFLYEELELVKQICKESGRDFEAYYREYCARVGIDIGDLDRRNKERLSSLYDKPEEESEEEREDGGQGDQDASLGALVAVDAPDEEAHTCPLTEEDKEIHEVFSKLFKKIAVALHPDKVNSLDISPFLAQEMIETFKSARKAYDERKYFVLIEIATQYKIYPPDNYGLQSKWFNRESQRIQVSIKGQKNTYNYIFSECPDEQKDVLIRNFLQRLFGI